MSQGASARESSGNLKGQVTPDGACRKALEHASTALRHSCMVACPVSALGLVGYLMLPVARAPIRRVSPSYSCCWSRCSPKRCKCYGNSTLHRSTCPAPHRLLPPVAAKAQQPSQSCTCTEGMSLSAAVLLADNARLWCSCCPSRCPPQCCTSPGSSRSSWSSRTCRTSCTTPPGCSVTPLAGCQRPRGAAAGGRSLSGPWR